MIKGNLRMEIKAVFEPRKRVVLPFMCLCFQVVFRKEIHLRRRLRILREALALYLF